MGSLHKIGGKIKNFLETPKELSDIFAGFPQKSRRQSPAAA
jgi:hypothetical protein